LRKKAQPKEEPLWMISYPSMAPTEPEDMPPQGGSALGGQSNNATLRLMKYIEELHSVGYTGAEVARALSEALGGKDYSNLEGSISFSHDASNARFCSGVNEDFSISKGISVSNHCNRFLLLRFIASFVCLISRSVLFIVPCPFVVWDQYIKKRQRQQAIRSNK
jgi:hypothetical protein